MTKITARVEFEFDIEGDPKEAQQSIREQIGSDTNEYYQNTDPRAQLLSWAITRWGIKE